MIRLDSDDCGFICAGVNFVGGYKWNALIVLFQLYNITNVPLFEQQQKLLISWQFSGPYDVTKYGSGWRKDVVKTSAWSLHLPFHTRKSHLRKFTQPQTLQFSL